MLRLFSTLSARVPAVCACLLITGLWVGLPAAWAHPGHSFCHNPDPGITVGSGSSLALSFDALAGELEIYKAVLILPSDFGFNGFTALGAANTEIGRQTITVGGITVVEASIRVFNANIAYVDVNNSGFRHFLEPTISHTVDPGTGDHVFTLIAYFGGDRDPSTHHVSASANITIVLNTGILTNPVGSGPYVLTGSFTSVDPDNDGADDGGGLSPITCSFAATFPDLEVVRTDQPPNNPPVARCQNVTVPAGATCQAIAGANDVNNGSSDPDGDALTLLLAPPGPYVLGNTPVTLTVDDGKGGMSTCQATVTIQDTTPPTIQCNAPGSITPPDAPISFRATAADNCSVSVSITGYDCWWINPADKRVDKTSSCVVSISGDTVTIGDTGGVNDNISWSAVATDGSGNQTTQTCQVQVSNPAL